MLSRRDIGVFIGELGRRRVFRVAVWYAAAAFAVLQLVDILTPTLNFGDTAARNTLYALLIAAPIVFVLAWYFDITPDGVLRTEGRASIEARGNSLAVLPFTDLNGSPDGDYFSDGVTEDIIAALSRVEGLHVISRTSSMQYRKTTRAIPQIAGELGVAHVLEGSIRRAGPRIRIVAKLVLARTDEQLWAETYDREMNDIFAIQSDVAGRIATALKAELTTAQAATLARGPTQRLEAYDAYLRGRHLWKERTERGMHHGVLALREAVETDPDFALAWSALAEAYVTQGMYGLAPPHTVMPLARESAERALLIESDLSEALTPLAAVRLHFDWNWPLAEVMFVRAIEANPRYPTAHQWYANLLAAASRFTEARAALEHARELDPLSPAVLTNAGIISFFERDYPRAVKELQRVVRRFPGFPLAHMFLGLTHDASGRPQDALGPLQAAIDLSSGTPESRAALACALARTGDIDDARVVLHGLESAEYVSPVLYAYAHAAFGEKDKALDALERAVEARSADLVWIGVRPVMDSLRDDPRFSNILQIVGTAAGAALESGDDAMP